MTRLRLSVCWFKQIMPEGGHGAFLFWLRPKPRCVIWGCLYYDCGPYAVLQDYQIYRRRDFTELLNNRSELSFENSGEYQTATACINQCSQHWANRIRSQICADKIR